MEVSGVEENVNSRFIDYTKATPNTTKTTQTLKNNTNNNNKSSSSNLLITIPLLFFSSGIGLAYLREQNFIPNEISNELTFLEPIQYILRLSGLGKNIEDSTPSSKSESIDVHVDQSNPSVEVEIQHEISEPIVDSKTNTDADDTLHINNQENTHHVDNEFAVSQSTSTTSAEEENIHHEQQQHQHEEIVEVIDQSQDSTHHHIDHQVENQNIQSEVAHEGVSHDSESLSTSETANATSSSLQSVTTDSSVQTQPPQMSSTDHFLNVRVSTLDNVLSEVAKQTGELKNETERALFRDLEGLDEKALRYRIIQLSAEFFDRIKWEGLRQQQALREAEAIFAQKYG